MKGITTCDENEKSVAKRKKMLAGLEKQLHYATKRWINMINL